MTNNSKNQFATKNDLKKMRGEISKDIKGFKDEIREDNKKHKDEMKTYMGVLYEKFDNEVKVVAEQYSGIERRLIKVESKTDMLVETVGEIKMDMTEMKSDMTEMKEEMTEMKSDMTEMKSDISELKTDMKEVKEELLPNTARKINKLEHRVTGLESRA